MAGIVEVLLKIIGDSRDAEAKLEETGRKADQTKAKVDQVDQSVQTTSTRATRLLGRLAELGTAVTTGVTATMAAGQAIFDEFDRLVLAPRRGDLEAKLGRAETPAEALDILADLSKGGWGWDKAFHAVLGTAKSFEQGEFLKRFRSLSDTQKQAVIAQIRREDRDWLTELLPKLTEETMPAPDWAKGFGASPGDGKVMHVQNVYTSLYAGGGRGSVGRQIKAATDIRDRNNGRYVTTFTRRG